MLLLLLQQLLLLVLLRLVCDRPGHGTEDPAAPRRAGKHRRWPAGGVCI